MNTTLEQPKKVWTEAELQALPDDGYIHELVDGELVMSPRNNFRHGDICIRLSPALANFVNSRRLGSRVRFEDGLLDAEPELPRPARDNHHRRADEREICSLESL
jgi:hypothetical protein